MAQSQQPRPEVVPHLHEYGEPVKRWQRELEGLHGHYDSQKALAEREYHAQRDKIRVSVLHRRQEQIAKLDADIHQYMHSVKLGIDSLLEELQTEKLHRLEGSYKGQLAELEKMRDQDMLKHLKKYRTLCGVSGEELPIESQQRRRSPLGDATREPGRGQKGKEIEPPAHRDTLTHQSRALPPPLSTVDHRTESARAPIGHRPQGFPLPPILSSNYHPAPGNPALGHPGMQPAMYGGAPPMSQMKRRMDEQVSPDRYETRKRQRVSLSVGEERATSRSMGEAAATGSAPRRSSGGNAPIPGPIPPIPERKRTTFDEVYQDGKPEYKHIIVEYPVDSNTWYILRCDEHFVHFGLKPLLGAAKHLHSSQHNNLPKHHSLAVDLLGILVESCDAEKVAKNNAMVAKAFEEGYQPFNVNRLTRTEKINQGYSVPETASEKKQAQTYSPQIPAKPPAALSPPLAVTALAPKPPRIFNGTTDPLPGQLYVGFWSKTKQKYAVMVLPFWGGIPDTPLKSAKDAAGNVRDIGSIGLVANAPRCIRVSRTTQQVIGWAKDYEDDGPLAMRREFPVVYFDRKYQIGWLACRNIKPFNFDDPHYEQIHDYHHARETYAELRGYKDFEEMKAAQPQGPPFLKREEIEAGALEGGKSAAETVYESAKAAYSAVRSPEHKDDTRDDGEREDDERRQSTTESLHPVVDGYDSEAEREDDNAGEGRSADRAKRLSVEATQQQETDGARELPNPIDAQQIAARALQGATGGFAGGDKSVGAGVTSNTNETTWAADRASETHRHTSLPRISTLHGILGTDQPSSASSPTSSPASKSAPSPIDGGSITLPPRKDLSSSLTEPTDRHTRPGSTTLGTDVSLGPGPHKPTITSPSTTSLDALSRHSTPAGGDGIDRWRAVHNPSYSASPQQSFASLGSQQDGLAEAKKDARIAAYQSPALTPGESIKANPLGEKTLKFNIASFYSDSRRFIRDDDEDSYLRLIVDSDKGIAETGPDTSMHLKIDPARIASTKCSSINDTTTAVQLEMVDKLQQKLIFESNDVTGLVVSAKDQAEKFCTWLNSKNGKIETRSSSSSSNKDVNSQSSMRPLSDHEDVVMAA